MHISPEASAHTERVFALQMLFLGLSLLLGLVVLIQYGSPGRRLNADGIYSAAPMYGVPHYPRPLSDFTRAISSSSSHQTQEAWTKSSESSSHSQRRAASSRAPEERERRRQERSRLEQESRIPSYTRSPRERNSGRFAPGWFWR